MALELDDMTRRGDAAEEERRPFARADTIPVDNFKIAYLIMVLLGTGLLLPYNALITSVDFLDATYPGKHLEYITPIVISVSSPPLQVLMIKYGARFSFTRRVVVGFLLEAAVLMAFPLFQGKVSEETGLVITLSCVFVLGVATAILQSTVFGFAAFLPARYTQAIMGGNGVAGLGVSLVRIATKASFSSSHSGLRQSALIFFAIAAFTTVMCVLGYIYILRLPFTQYYMERSGNAFLTPSMQKGGRRRRTGRSSAARLPPPMLSQVPTGTVTEHGTAVVPSDDDLGQGSYLVERSATMSDFMTHAVGTTFGHGEESALLLENEGGAGALLSSDDSPGGVKEGEGGAASPAGNPEQQQQQQQQQARVAITNDKDIKYIALFRKVMPLALSVFAVFFCTFLVFPGMISELPSSMGLHHGWFAILLITEFNVFDLLGRSLPAWGVLLPHRLLPAPTAARFLLVPLFALCANPRVFANDGWAYGFMALLAFSNGHLASVAMMAAPGTVAPEEREAAGYLMSFTLNFGIVSGSGVALLLNYFGVGVPK